MPSAPFLNKQNFRILGTLVLALGLSSVATGQEGSGDAVPEALEDIPDRFFQIQDANGFFWQATGGGALTSGETQYLQSGLNLLVEGAVFAPKTGKVRTPGAEGDLIDIELVEAREQVRVTRNLLFDPARGSVRVLDSFRNDSGAPLSLSVHLRTTYPFAWQSLHNLEGQLLSSDPVLALSERDEGMIVHFSPVEGRHDTILVLRAGEDAIAPELTASNNRRELTLRYRLDIPAGETRSLFHWISQRAVPSLSEVSGAFSDLLQRGRLVRPEVAPDRVGEIANFSRSAFPDPGATPTKLKSLVALNAILDRIGVLRRPTDLLWVSASNQVSGVINPEASFVVQNARFGERKLAIKEVAAIQGGAGIGRTPLFFLRDGRVVRGTASAENLGIRVGNGDAETEVSPERLALLLCRTEAGDGTPPGDTIGFLELTDGNVIAVSGPDALALNAATAWGSVELPVGTIRDLSYFSRPRPGFRVRLEDGSRFTAFLSPGEILVNEAGGEDRAIRTAEIARFWRSDSTIEVAEFDAGYWLDFEETPSDRPLPGFLLQGNNLLAGSFGDESISLIENGIAIRVDPSRIRKLTRKIDLAEDGSPLFVIEWENGEQAEGSIEQAFVTILRGETQFIVPVERLLGYSAPTSD